jgi:cell fate regulator YaaT (PSP1 superfamily)
MNSSAELKNTETKDPQFPRFVIGIRYKGNDRSTLFDPGNFQLRVGNHVIVQTQKGSMLGIVASNRLPNFQKEKNKNLPKVLRTANDRDMQAYFETEKREKKATMLCLDLIKNFSRFQINPSFILLLKAELIFVN